MRELTGILIGCVGFLLLSSYTVKKFGTSSVSQKAGHSSARPHATLPPTVPASRPPTVPSGTSEHLPSPQRAIQPLPVTSSQEPTTPRVPASPPFPPTSLVVSRHPPKVIHFQAGCTSLSRSDRTTLNALVPTLQKTPRQYVNIHGHTDDSGNPQFNQELSRLRADIVRYYLSAQGIDETRLTAHGYGASFPIADNRSPHGRQRNRRTEIILQHESPTDN